MLPHSDTQLQSYAVTARKQICAYNQNALNNVCEYTVSHDTVFTSCLLATIPGNQIIGYNRNLLVFRLDSLVVNWESQPVKTLCRKPGRFCCHISFGFIVQWTFWLRERGYLVLSPDQLICMRPAALSKNKVWTHSLVKLGRNYMSISACCRTNQTAQGSKLCLTSSQIHSLQVFGARTLQVTDNAVTPTITDRRMSTGPSFPSESVQTLFFGVSAGHTKNLVWG